MTGAQGTARLQVLRFLVVGGSNTLLTYALYVLLARSLHPRAAYTIVFAVGVAYSVLLTGRFVFGARRRWSTSLAYAAWYLVVYGVGLLVLWLVTRLGVERPSLSGLAVIGVTAPLNFLGGRLLFRPTPTARSRAEVSS